MLVYTRLIAAFLLILTDVAALKCYICIEFGDDACSKEKLEGNPAKYSENCSSFLNYDRCMRTKSEALGIKAVSTSCATQDTCSASESACDKTETCKDVVCCDTDNCNAGSAVSFSVFLVAICYAVGLALMK